MNFHLRYLEWVNGTLRNIMSRKQEIANFCQCAGCKPASAVARGNTAICMLKTQRELGRPFEHCFENKDADDVVRHVTRMAATDKELEACIRRVGYGYWLDPVKYDWLWKNEPHPFSTL